MKQKYFFYVLLALCLTDQKSFAGYADQYLTALQDLISVHKKYFPHEPIAMNNSSIIYTVYKKIITPWALNINGLAHIVENNFQSKRPYFQDIQNLWIQFQKAQSQVKNLKRYFPDIDESALLQVFYKEIGVDVVQIFFNLIQDCTNALSDDQQDLAASFIAYQIAYTMYQSDMQISNIQDGSDFDTTISGNMVILYQNAIKNLVNKLSIGMLQATDIETIYDQIARYYTYLSIVATNINDVQLISSTQAQAAQACQNYGYYLQAQSLYQIAENLLKNDQNTVYLDVKNVSSVVTSLQSVGKNIGQVIQATEQSVQYYTQAQDIFGANQAQLLWNVANNIDLWIVQGLAQLWVLYLQDQSSVNQYTAPSIAKFISSQNKNSNNPIMNNQIIAAFQNLSGLIQNSSNSINALSTVNVLKEYSIDQIINSLKQQLLAIVQSGTMNNTSSSWIYNFASLQAINAVEDILFYLTNLSNSIVVTLTNSDKNSALEAMAYAQALDAIYTKLPDTVLKQVNSLVPYFPKQIQKVKSSSWSDWTKQILLTSLTVSVVDLNVQKIAKIKINNPTSQEPVLSQTSIDTLVSLAHQNALNGNYSEAFKQYQNIMNMYATLYSINPNDTAAYTGIMVSKTMYTALSFAATIQSSGNQTWGGIDNIPTEFTASRLGFNGINSVDLGMSQLPASMLSFKAGMTYTAVSKQQKKDILQMIKAYIISQLLKEQAMQFSDIFVDYRLNFNSQIDKAGKALANQIRAQVDVALNKFEKVEIVSIVCKDASTIESVVCNNIVLRFVNPLISSMATALNFYMSSQLLVQPSTQDIQLGNVSYVSANDEQLSQIFLEKIIKVYVAASYPHAQEAERLMENVTSLLQKNQKKSDKSFPVNFANSLKIIDSHIVRAQALLYAQGQSAYAYATKAQDQNLAEQIEALFFSMYQTYVTWLEQSLNDKNPFDPTYQLILHKINTVYVAWAALLQAQGKTSQVNTINNDIVSLFTKAGNGCMNISYTEPLYPNFIQYHYATAAHYFLAVQTQYTKMKENSNAQSVNSLINDAYFKGSSQNIDLFLHVQKNGVVVTHEDTKEQEAIAFSTLIDQKIFSSTAEQNAYDSVQNLLLNAGMGYSFLIKRVQGVSDQNQTSKQAIAQNAQGAYTQNVTTFLQNQNIMSSTDTQPNYFTAGVAESIFKVNLEAYYQFKNSSDDYASWLSVVYSALQALYAFNYLGAQEGETGQQMQNQMTQFFSELEKHTSSLENPSFAYVG